MKKILVFTFIFYLVLPLLSQVTKVKVITERANFYVEPNVNSFIIETLEKGTILNSYSQGKTRGNWYYCYFKSDKRGAVVTGFIQASFVELVELPKIIKEGKKELSNKEEIQKTQELTRLEEKTQAKKGEIVSATEKEKIEKVKPVTITDEKAQRNRKKFIKFNYNMGLSETDKSISWSEEVFYEDASYDINYKFKKGNSFDIGMGYNFSNSIGIELGIDICNRNINADYSTSIPHPLLFNSSRYGENTGSYQLTENTAYLNLIYSIYSNKFSVDIFGGLAYFLSSAELISGISFTHSYPYESINISASNEKLKRTSFGFDVGSSLNFYFAKSFGIFIKAQYFSASADFNPGGDIPGWKLSLGGFKAGGGLKIIF